MGFWIGFCIQVPFFGTVFAPYMVHFANKSILCMFSLMQFMDLNKCKKYNEKKSVQKYSNQAKEERISL